MSMYSVARDTAHSSLQNNSSVTGPLSYIVRATFYSSTSSVKARMSLCHLLNDKVTHRPIQCRVVAGLRRSAVRANFGLAAPACKPQHRQATRLHVALAEPPGVQSSFATLLDDEDEYEYEFEEGEEIEEVDVSLLVENQGLSDEVVYALKKRGINSLFPIQRMVLQPAMEGSDLIGRAKTGSGKTLAFTLPVVESLLTEDTELKAKRTRGRTPRCLIMAPTRELAKQVATEFESVCPSLEVLSVYGGTSINNQIDALRKGVDVVVGTPGRIMDLLDRKSLKGDKVRFVVLDEADQMLDMGFEEDMEVILQQMPEDRQTMLFSATLPTWVKKVARRYQKSPKTIDLVGEEQTGKLNEDVTLNVMQVSHTEKKQALLDLLSVYAAGGKAIVFTKTKLGADEVAAALSHQQPTEALHGDIAQSQREKTLGRFRKGDVSVLIATDVAARGLDIPNVDLVVHYDPPQDSESFLHRSGRTGRAGNKGRAIVLHTPSETRSLGMILQQVKLSSGEVIGAPSPADVMASASRTVLSKLDRVESGVIDFFMPAATRLMQSPQPERVLAAALASMSGFRTVGQERSLLTGEAGMVTLRLLAAPGRLDGFNSTLKFLEKLVNVRLSDQVGKLRIISEADKEGVAVDLPARVANAVVAAADQAAALGVAVDKPHSLPLDVKDMVLGRRSGRPPLSDRSVSPRGSFRGGRGGRDRGGRDGYYGQDRGDRGGRGRDRDARGQDSFRSGGRDGRDGGFSKGGRFGWESEGGRSRGGSRGGKSRDNIW